MTYDREMQEAEHRKTADRISRFLDQGKMVACLVLGDPSIYSSYCYYQQILIQKGYQAEMISGVPSFCAVAAKLNIPLIEWQEQMHIIPAAHQEDLSAYASGTSVYMKTGRRLKELKEHLQKDDTDVYMVENCGMEGERVCLGTNQLPDLSRYYVTVVVKNK
jgi:precorrin-2/cobalt-factor-2 C20-methyltransferase